MSTIRAIYEGGVFRPIDPVDLPDHATFEIELKPVGEAEDADGSWMAGVSREWAEDWSDPRDDIYTLDDGEAVHEPR